MKAHKINIKQAKELTIDIIKSGRTPMITSSPGLGKSDYIKRIAKDFNLKLIDIRLSQADSVDLNGYPTIDLENNISRYVPFDTFPTEATPIPDGYEGWLLLFDELTSAPNLTQAAAYKLILDKEVGQEKLHSKAITVAAGNLTTDKAIVNKISTALQSRMIHLEIAADLDCWVEWAIQNNIDYRIIGFLQFRPELLHKFDPNHDDNTFPCPRTWHFLSDLINKWKDVAANKLPLLIGCVGQGAGTEFMGFLNIFSILATKEQILAKPESVVISDDPSVKYAFTTLISSIAEKINLDKLMIFVNRLPLEFQVITIKQIIAKDTSFYAHPAISKWQLDNIDELT